MVLSEEGKKKKKKGGGRGCAARDTRGLAHIVAVGAHGGKGKGEKKSKYLVLRARKRGGLDFG